MKQCESCKSGNIEILVHQEKEKLFMCKDCGHMKVLP